MHTWFTELFKNFFVNDIYKLDYNEVVKKALDYVTQKDYVWPISDFIHLLKCARAHVQGHLTCVDPDHFICVNIELLEEAANLKSNLENKTTQARMSDQFALELFSYDTFIKLMKNDRFEAAMYILPFMCLNEAIRSSFISKDERHGFLKIAYKSFLFQLRNINVYSGSTLFPPSYHKNALGALLSEKIFLQRCISTTREVKHI